jgi:hypothetical protein
MAINFQIRNWAYKIDETTGFPQSILFYGFVYKKRACNSNVACLLI